MAYDDELAARIRELIGLEPDVAEKRMFGGLAFLVGGHMAVTVSRQGGLMMHVPDDEYEELLALPHVHPFEMRGKPARGWIRVSEAGVESDDELREWVRSGLGYARSLPPK